MDNKANGLDRLCHMVMELFVGDTEDLEMIETSSCVFNKANGLGRLCHIVMELFVRDTEDLEMSSCVFNKANALGRLCHILMELFVGDTEDLEMVKTSPPVLTFCGGHRTTVTFVAQ